MGNKEHDILPTHGQRLQKWGVSPTSKGDFLGGMGLHPSFMGNGELNWGWDFRVRPLILIFKSSKPVTTQQFWEVYGHVGWKKHHLMKCGSLSSTSHSGSSPNLPVISVHHGDNLPGGHALGQHDIPHGDGTDLH